RGEHVQHQRPALGQDRVELPVHAGIDHDRADPVGLGGGPDLGGGGAGLGDGVDEGDPVGDEAEAGELGQQAVADGLGGDAGAVGDVEHGAGGVGIHLQSYSARAAGVVK